MNAAWLRPRWLFSRRAAKALLLAVVIIAAAVGANLVGIYLVGSVAGWERWLAVSAGYFLVWRLCLYGATVYGWVWMRTRNIFHVALVHALVNSFRVLFVFFPV